MATKPADLSALEIPRVEKGAAVPLASKPVPAPEPPPPAAVPATAEMPLGEVREPSTAATFRLPISLQERLREAAHRRRITKTDIVERALNEYLKGMGF
ncbi:hypothetical protein [Roseomonas chloroacetimidivorans]|uniref:hypothetical protein n=1 Tax=Roseomonas chloroacetimidivorans TaxID=1766656 RepID=UPI003C73DAE4